MKQGKKVVVGIMALATAFGAFGFAGCKDEEAAVVPPTTEQGNVQSGTTVSSGRKPMAAEPQGEPYDGQIVRCGESYALTGKIGFLSEELTALAETGDDLSVELVATVTPADAKQDVSWSVAFVNASSEWATGKNVADYVTVTPTTENGTTATVTCKKAFSEQIKITVTSVWDTTKTVECVVDFVSAYQNVTLTMGEDIVNLGGVTDVWWELNENANAGVAWGGDISVAVTTEENGTVSGYTYRVDILSPRAWHDSDTLILEYDEDGYYAEYYDGSKAEYYNQQDSDGYLQIYTNNYDLLGDSYVTYDCELDPENHATANDFNYEYSNLSSLYLSDFYMKGVEGTSLFSPTAAWYLAENYTCRIDEGSLCTVLLTITTASGTVMQYTSLLNLTEFTYTPAVEALSLSTSKIKVTYEP